MPKVLVADDSLTVRQIIERVLTSVGFEVVLATDGEEAIAWLAKERPDLVVSDIRMPAKSGFDVCEFVKTHPTLSDIPVLLIAGAVDAEVQRQAKACRADDVLKKPFKGAILLDRARKLLGSPQIRIPKVLVVDDSVSFSRVIESQLTSAGLEVALTASGEKAVAWLAKERPDLIIADIYMPGMSGFELCEFVKTHPTLSGTPVLLITGIVDEETRRQAKACRADDVLKKPLTGSALYDRIKELLAAR